MVIVAKVCLLGDPAVGKTSLVRRFVYGTFEGSYLSTIGTQISRKDVSLGNEKVTLVIWDIAGHMKYNQLASSYYSGALGAILVCDITRRETLMTLPYWAAAMRNQNPDAVMVVAVNKTDLMPMAQFTMEDAKMVGDKIGSPVFATSALNGRGVEDAFNHLAQAIASRSQR